MERKNKIYDLFVVGNGFDIACNYDTTYSSYLKSGLSNNSCLFRCFANTEDLAIFDGEWNSFEKILCHYICFIKYLFSNKSIKREFADNNPSTGGFNKYVFYIPQNIVNDISAFISFKSIGVTMNEILTLYSNNGRIIRDYWIFLEEMENNEFPMKLIFYNHFNKNEIVDSIAEKRILKKIEEEIKKLEDGLKEYIKKETSKKAQLSNFLKNLVEKNDFKTLLSFNYSRCGEEILNIEKENTFYIHGNIENHVVLGIESNMIPNQLVNEDSDYCIFFKKYRRILKETSLGFYNKIINKLKETSRIGVYGHSLDLADQSIFKKIFNLKAEYDIYCYEESNTYKEKLSRLIGLDLLDELFSKNKIHFIVIPNEKIK